MASQIPLHVEVLREVMSCRRDGNILRYEHRENKEVRVSVGADGKVFCEYPVAEFGDDERVPVAMKEFRGRAALTNACKFAVKKILKQRTVSAEEPNGHSGVSANREGGPEAGAPAPRALGSAEGSGD